jgi:hypothetical protein
MTRSVFVLFAVLTCAFAIAADGRGPVISGTLYVVAQDGKEAPPTAPSRVHIGYWDGDALKASFTGETERGRVVLVSTLGTARVNADGTFSITVTQEGLPKGIVLVGLLYHDAANRPVTIQRRSGEPVKIDISKAPARVELGRIRIK